jgi:hypothetical protein
MNRLLAPSTNSNSATAGRCDRGACDSHPWRLPRVGSDVVALSICDDVRSKPALGDGGGIFIGSPRARLARLSPRIAL